MRKKTFILSAFFVLFSLAFWGCTSCPLCGRPYEQENQQISQPKDIKNLRGTVSCLQRIPVLATYELTIKLCYTEDITGNVKVVAEKTISNFNAFPVEFSLEYDNASLKEDSVYYVDAYVCSRGIKLLQADSKIEVLTRGARSVADVVLVRAEN